MAEYYVIPPLKPDATPEEAENYRKLVDAFSKGFKIEHNWNGRGRIESTTKRDTT